MNKTNPALQAALAHRVTRSVRQLALAATLGLPWLVQAQAPFATPQAAGDAFIDAVASNDQAALARVIGSDWRRLLSVDEVSRDDVYAFLEKASQSRVVNLNGGRGELVVGKEPWSLPIPLVQGKDGSWRFDATGAREQIAQRRIGANERAAINTALAYVDAQREYALVDRTGNGVREYAQRMVSSPGKRDGLIWSQSLGDESPLGEDLVPKALGQGYHGYHFKILTAQGPAANGGARNYVIGQRMRSGFALLAWPVSYGVTGVMSFMVSHDGVVFERNLGPGTASAAAATKVFNPDPALGWKPTAP